MFSQLLSARAASSTREQTRMLAVRVRVRGNRFGQWRGGGGSTSVISGTTVQIVAGLVAGNEQLIHQHGRVRWSTTKRGAPAAPAQPSSCQPSLCYPGDRGKGGGSPGYGASADYSAGPPIRMPARYLTALTSRAPSGRAPGHPVPTETAGGRRHGWCWRRCWRWRRWWRLWQHGLIWWWWRSRVSTNATGTSTYANTGGAGGAPGASGTAGTNGSVTISYTVKSDDTITFGSAPSMTYGGSTGTVSATSPSGDTITYSSSTTSVCTISGTTVTAVTAGSCTIHASTPGSSTYNAGSADQTFTIARAASNLAFTSGTSLAYGSTLTVTTSTSNSEVGVVYAVDPSTSSNCTISGAVVTPTAITGTCVVNATQAQTTNYSADSTSSTINLSPQPPGLAFTSGTTLVYGASMSMTASSASGGTISYSLTSGPCSLVGGTLTATSGTGTCVVQASQGASGNYTADSVSSSIALQKANQAALSISSSASRRMGPISRCRRRVGRGPVRCRIPSRLRERRVFHSRDGSQLLAAHDW